jgi:hypothetical protein
MSDESTRSRESLTSQLIDRASRDQSDRIDILTKHGATPAEVDELAAYTESRFQVPDGPLAFPLEDEPHVEAWSRYAAEAETAGVFPVLRDALVQLHFPVRAGISATETYRAATLRGILPDETRESSGLVLRRPEGLRLLLHPTPAGRIPALVVPDRADFIALVQALGMRNEPKPVPPSMGATIVAGLINWDRVAELHSHWASAHLFSDPALWDEELDRIRPQKALYQDRLLILSTGPYSGVEAGEMGLSVGEWLDLSYVIRLEHECTHYTMRRIAGSMRNNALDEVLADYVGILRAAGTYRADWLLHFLGLENWPTYRPGGRLEIYRGSPPLSNGAFRVLQALTHDAVLALAQYPAASFQPGDLVGQGRALLHLATLSLLDLARMT